MDTLFFSKDALIEIQGEDVIQLDSLHENYASYQVIGFDNPAIVIKDYRPVGVREIKQGIERGYINNFARHFNSFSRVEIKKEAEKIVVELHCPKTKVPRFMLWIANGVGNRIPLYRFRIFKAEPTVNGKFALFSLYKRPYRRGVHQPVDYSPCIESPVE